MEAEESPQWEEVRRKMHLAIDRKDRQQVQECLREAPHLKLWLHPSNGRSAMYRAVKNDAFAIYGMLLSHTCDLKNDIERRCFDDLNKIQQYELRRQNFFGTKYKDSYLDRLKRRTASQTKLNDFEVKVDHMFQVLDSVELIRPVLQVAAMAHHLLIRFDFERADVQPMVGCGNKSTLGITDSDRDEIFVGAKMLESSSLDEVVGTLAHELCHFALNTVYNNEGKPYFRHVIENGEKYREIIQRMKRNKDVDKIIKLAFEYDTEAELIVRVPHILALHAVSGHGISILQSQAPELLEFYEKRVLPDIIEHTQNACPSIDTENIMKENDRLGKVYNIEKRKVFFKKTLTWLGLDKPLIILTSHELALLEILVHNAVRSTSQPYLCFEVSLWDDTLEDILRVNKCRVILLTCNHKEDFPNKLAFLSLISRVVGTKVILLIHEGEQAYFVGEVQKDPFFSIDFPGSQIISAVLENVTEECMDEVRTRCYLRFQETECYIPLRRIVDRENFSLCIGTRMFLQLFESPYIFVGPSLCEPKQGTYVKRRLKQFFEVNKASLNADSPNDVFAFCGCYRETVCEFLSPHEQVAERWWINLGKFVLHDDVEQHYYLEKAYGSIGKTVHLLEYVKSFHGHGLKHTDRLPFTEVVYHTEDFLLGLQDKLVVICGAPGVGKSALALRLCKELKNMQKKRWVLYVSLPQRVGTVDAGTDMEDLQKLAALCGVKEDGLEFFLFRQSVHQGVPFETVIIFDAFDEVHIEHRQYVLKLVKYLTQTKVSRVFLMSNTALKTLIEDATHTVAYEVAPFTYDDSLQYMIQYWVDNGASDVPYEELRTSAKGVLDQYLIKFGFPDTPLMVPLFTGIVAELHSSPLAEESSVSKNMNAFDVLKKFVDIKYGIYLKEKIELKLNTSSSAVGGATTGVLEQFYDVLDLLAMNVIFDNDLLKILAADERKDLGLDNGILKLSLRCNLVGHGIVDGLRDGIPLFLHRSLAEFFAAHFLFQKVKRIGSHRSGLVKAVLGLYKDSSYEQVMLFFDCFAADASDLHSAIIRGDASYVNNMTEKDLYELDDLGRTPLHVAAIHAVHEVLCIFPVNRSPIRKDMLGMTPITYAEMREDPRILDTFCERFTGTVVDFAEDFPAHFRNVTRVRSLRQSVLYILVKDNRCSPLTFILSRLCRKRSECHLGINPHLVDVDTIRDDEGRTLLFYARTTGVLELLLPYCDLRAADDYGYNVLHYGIKWYSRDTICTMSLKTGELIYVHSSKAFLDIQRKSALQLTTEEVESKLVKLLLLRSLKSPEATWRSELLQYSYEPHVINLLLPHVLISEPVNVPFLTNSRDTAGRTRGVRVNIWKAERHLLFYSPQKVCKAVSSATYRDRFEPLLPHFETGDISKYVTKILANRATGRRNPYLPLIKQSILRSEALFTDDDGRTALHLCVKSGMVDEMKLLLPHTDVRAKDNEGKTVSETPCLVSGKQQEVTEMLRHWMAVNRV